jgi:hypothetical protein
MTTYSKNLTNELKLSPFGRSDGEIRILTLGESGTLGVLSARAVNIEMP